VGLLSAAARVFFRGRGDEMKLCIYSQCFKFLTEPNRFGLGDSVFSKKTEYRTEPEKI
jgi:hypothetical protein